MSQRTEKVGSVIKRAISQIISDFAKENNAGLSSVNKVVVSPDLQQAKIFVSCFGGGLNNTQFVEILEKYNNRIKSVISKETELRFIPTLKFMVDDSQEKIDEIQSIINKIHSEEGRI